jgi:intracellular septation protein
MRTLAIELLKDFISAIVFLIADAITHDLVLATGIAIAVSVVQLIVGLARREPIPAMQWLSFVLVVSLGSASVLRADDRFIRLKPTAIHFAIALVMLKAGWQRRYLPQIVRDWLTDGELRTWEWVWAGAMAVMGTVNALAAFWLSVGAWGMVLTGLLLLKPALAAVQYISLRTSVRRRRAGAKPAA